MEALLSQLVERLKKIYQERLVSVILYGSAATGDRQAKFSDYNVLCVLSQITPAELSDSEAV
jgi:predicted nucleotidyltransferase